jgi:hypothetical protein
VSREEKKSSYSLRSERVEGGEVWEQSEAAQEWKG